MFFEKKTHKRVVTKLPKASSFLPAGIPITEMGINNVKIEELETMHLVDLRKMKQEEAARKMHVSRKTFWKDLKSARRKVTDALLNGKMIKIEGGNYKLTEKER